MTTMARNGLRARNPCLLSRWYKQDYLSCHCCWPSKQAVGISNLSFEVDLEPLVWDMILSCVMYLQGQMPVPIHLSDYVHLVLQLLSILLIFVSKLQKGMFHLMIQSRSAHKSQHTGKTHQGAYDTMQSHTWATGAQVPHISSAPSVERTLVRSSIYPH